MMAQEIYVVIEFDRETHEFSEIEAIYQSKEEAENLVKEHNAKFLRYSYEWFEETYHAEEVDAVLAEKDAENRRLKRALWLARAQRAADKQTYYNECRYDGWVHRVNVWLEVERKCRDKAEEYK